MVTAKNPITGDTIASKPTSDAFRNNFDAIFRKTVEACDMGEMCLDCQPRGANGECPDRHEPDNEPQCSENAQPAPPELEQAVKRSIDNRVQWPFPTVNGERQ
jgi:hypothetical protein